ncbi:MAG TPA: hypothetical protein VGG72_08215 [Bryobacteraceae bacterium]
MKRLRLICGLWALGGAWPAIAQSWTLQTSNTKAALRGINAVSEKMAWAGGAKGVFLRTIDGGDTWIPGAVPGGGDADFRGVLALSDKFAYLLSSGAGPVSRLYKTIDGGVKWDLIMVNPDPKGFWDAIAMWDPMHGILLGDPVNGRFVIYTMSDGDTWVEQKGPPAQAQEGAFAASNSSLVVRGAHEAWFGTGGAGGGRVFHSMDDGKTWTVAKTPVRHDSESAGIFSIAFSDGRHGVAVGGDYSKPGEGAGSIAITDDGGKTWAAPAAPLPGYRSAVVYLDEKKMWIATGTSGSDVSVDGGRTWKGFDTASYNAMSFVGSIGWAVGPGGVIARLSAP